MRFTAVAVFALAAAVSAQTLDQLPKCVQDCVTKSIASTKACASITQTECICSNADFQKSATACLARCTADERKAAVKAEKDICTSQSTSATSGASETSSSAPTGSNSAAITGATGSHSATVSTGSTSTVTPSSGSALHSSGTQSSGGSSTGVPLPGNVASRLRTGLTVVIAAAGLAVS